MINDLIPYSACPICQSRMLIEQKRADLTKHPLYTPQLDPVIIWMVCGTCGHNFRSGHYQDWALDIIFSETHENQKLGYRLENQRPVSARMIEKVTPFCSSGDWLDVGFGNGSLLLTAAEYGFNPVGLDLRSDNAHALKHIGLESYCERIENLTFDGRFSVLSMADVLEHVPFPLDILKAAYRLLRAEGVLFLSMPNTEAPVWKLLDLANANPYWAEIEHYHNFGRSQLSKILEDNGFNPVRYGISERYRACMEILAIKN